MITTVILFILYSTSLVLIHKISKITFVRRVIILMILCNAGEILVVFMNKELLKEPPPKGIFVFIVL